MQETVAVKKDKYPLSLSQKNIWNVELSHKGTSINNICSTIRIEGRFDLARIKEAINLVLMRDSTLRTRITAEGGVPLQYTVPFEEEQFPVFDFSLTGRSGVAHWEAAVTREAMELLDSPLYSFAIFRTGEEDGGILVKVHHIISDGWSQMLMSNRIAEVYLALLSAEQPDTSPSPSYALHIERENGYLASSAYERDMAFWEDRLSGFSAPSSIRECKSASLSPVGQRRTFRLSGVLNHAIKSFCDEYRVAPFSVLYMALAIYLRRTGGRDNIAIGVPVLNRVNFSEKQSTGMFVSTLPFIGRIDESWTLKQFNEELSDAWYDLLRHQKLSFSEINSAAKRLHPDMARLFDIVLSYQNSRTFKSRDASVTFSGRWHYSGYQAEPLLIHLSSMDEDFRYSIDYDYLTQVFSAQDIEQLHGYLMQILGEALSHPDAPIWQLSMLGHDEQEKVLFSFNDTARPRESESVAGAFIRTAREHPDRAAVICGGVRTSYAALLEGACRCAGAISRLTQSAGPVCVLLEKSTQLIEAMMGAALSGRAWITPSVDTPKERLLAMVSGASLIVTAYDLIEKNALASSGTAVLDIDTLENENAFLPPLPRDGSGPAYVVYTSGTTGKPKGVVITGDSLLNFSANMRPYYGYGAVLSVCSTGFDAFVLESTASLLNGKTVILARPEEQESPASLAALIENYAAGFLALTPSRLEAYMKHPAFRRALGRLQSIVCGGEHFPGDLLATLKLYTKAQIYNQYGPSETTVGVSIKLLNDAQKITAGKPLPNCRFYVLDAHRQPLPVGIPGELYIGGLCVGKGYFGAPSLDAERFFKSPFEPGERLYKTGDTARWTPDGEIVLMGRIDTQVKLRGLRIETDEVAARIAAYPSVRQAFVQKVCRNGGEFLAAWYTADEPVSESDLLAFVVSYLPAYMLPACFIRLDQMPLTANGKVDAARLPAPPEQSGGAPQSESEAAVLEIFRAVLGRDDIGPGSDYFLCGGDSLNAMDTLLRLEQAFGVRMKVADLYLCRTARRLTERLGFSAPSLASCRDVIPKAPDMDSYPLSPTQLSLYFETQLDPKGLSYNMPGAFRLKNGVYPDRLEEAFRALIQAEESLRTGFVMENGGVRQRIAKDISFRLERFQADSFDKAAHIFVRPFDLTAPPLLRAALWQEPDGGTVLFADMHHLISDGISTPILLRRLDALYHGKTPSFSSVSYRDYVCWQEAKGPCEQALSYWESRLSGVSAPLELPTDYPRQKGFSFSGGKLFLSLDAGLSAACESYCEKNELSPYMLFMAAFGLLLSKISGSSDFLVGTPVSGRSHESLQNVLGAFIHTLPFRISLGDGTTLRDWLMQIKTDVSDMLDHQDCTIEQLSSLFGAGRSLEGGTLYNTMFTYRPFSRDDLTFGGERITYLPVDTKTSKLDLTVEAEKSAEGFSFTFEYSTALFAKDTIALYLRSFEAILRDIVANDSRTAKDVSAISAADRFTLIEQPCHMRTPYLAMPVDMLFDHMSDLTPDAPAVIFHGNTTSFSTLRQKAESIAALLQRKGVKRGGRVAFAMRRSPELIAAMLGVLKAGCAYVPVLPSFPEKRLSHMLKLSEASLLLADDASLRELPDSLPCPVVNTAEQGGSFSPVSGRSAEDLIHVLFTSGSTGEPKGVEIPHRAVANLLLSVSELTHGVQGSFLSVANVIFDTFITETLLTLALGKCTVLADEEEMMLPWKMAELMERHNATIIQLTPSRLQMCLGNSAFAKAVKKTELAYICGEVFPAELLKRMQSMTDARILNLYGPTEVTVYINAADVTHRDRPVLGKPFHNCRIYVLDDHLRPVMPTAAGEVYIAGECLSVGYAGRDDMTRERYLPDPFFPGQRMYKSGDIARLLPDGYYDFVGRRDMQVKLNGQRIELDEITGRLLGVPWVSEAAAVVSGTSGGVKELVAFVVVKDGQQADIPALRRTLSDELPHYMVPSSIILLDELPRTATGKTDRRALEAYTAPRDERPAPVPENTADVRGTLLSIWGETLDLPHVCEELSFFEQGGNSLMALSALSRYFDCGLSMTLAQFYENPTIAAQCRILEGHPAAGRPCLTAAEQPESRTDSAPPLYQEAKAPKTAVAVTGATGYLGVHIIKALLDAGHREIICLVRGGDKARLGEALSWYFGSGWAVSAFSHIHVTDGDMTKPLLGMSGEIAEKTATLIHAAADVRHFVQDEAESVNANSKGAANAVEFAEKYGAHLCHISTMSVAGEYLEQAPEKPYDFSETDRDVGQNWRDNVYVRGKFLAENAVFSAMEKGLSAQIFRVGRLVGRSTDGVFQRDPEKNSFFSFAEGLCLLSAIPKSAADFPVELTAVDLCAEAIVRLIGGPSVCHVFNPNTLSLEALAEALLCDVSVLDDAAFEARLRNVLSSAPPEKMAMLLDVWTRMKSRTFVVRPSAGATIRALKQQGFCWPDPNASVLLRAVLNRE